MASYAPSFLFHVAHDLMSFQSISCNVLLWLLIVRHTPHHLKSYSVMLLFTSTYELASAITGFFLFPRIISLGNEAFILVIYGPCAYFENSSICYTVYGLELNALTFYNLQMTASFAFRFYVCSHPTPSIMSTIKFNFVVALPTTICFILFNLGRSPLEEALPLFEKYVPQYNLSGARLEANMDPIHNPAVATTLWVCATALPCFWTNVYCGRSIHRFLNKKASHLAERTRSLHKQLLEALISQCLISQVFMIAVTCFLLGHFGIIKHPALEYGVHFFGDTCIACSPLTTLYFVAPYRMKVVEIFIRRRKITKEITEGSSSMTRISVIHVIQGL